VTANTIRSKAKVRAGARHAAAFRAPIKAIAALLRREPHEVEARLAQLKPGRSVEVAPRALIEAYAHILVRITCCRFVALGNLSAA
jgi:hypothetical protein